MGKLRDENCNIQVQPALTQFGNHGTDDRTTGLGIRTFDKFSFREQEPLDINWIADSNHGLPNISQGKDAAMLQYPWTDELDCSLSHQSKNITNKWKCKDTPWWPSPASPSHST
jgi:hypothetical protein